MTPREDDVRGTAVSGRTWRRTCPGVRSGKEMILNVKKNRTGKKKTSFQTTNNHISYRSCARALVCTLFSIRRFISRTIVRPTTAVRGYKWAFLFIGFFFFFFLFISINWHVRRATQTHFARVCCAPKPRKTFSTVYSYIT